MGDRSTLSQLTVTRKLEGSGNWTSGGIFAVSSSCISFVTLSLSHSHSIKSVTVCWSWNLEVLVTELGRVPYPSNLRCARFNTILCQKYTTINFGSEEEIPSLGCVSGVLHASFRYISSAVIHWLQMHLPQNVCG